MGKLIVLEGTDGSGKATQTQLLCDKFAAAGKKFIKLEFPRYNNESSALVRLYLGGAFGENPDDVNAYAASTFFAVDRYASFMEQWKKWYEEGGLVITDRYTTSNAVHQASKLPDSERDEYVDWLFNFEYELMGIPKPDVVIYLDMPTDITGKMMTDRGNEKDIHEKNSDYLARCRQNALGIAEKCGWNVINCAKDGHARTREDIAEEIYSAVSAVLEV